MRDDNRRHRRKRDLVELDDVVLTVPAENFLVLGSGHPIETGFSVSFVVHPNIMLSDFNLAGVVVRVVVGKSGFVNGIAVELLLVVDVAVGREVFDLRPVVTLSKKFALGL